jgi:hypothetical protein
VNTAILDIETTDLGAVGAGTILCAVVKPLGKKPIVFRVDALGCKLGHEDKFLRVLLRELAKYQILVGHNIEKFDWCYIKSRCAILDVPFALRPFGYDTMKAFRRSGLRTRINGFGKPSAGMDMIVDFFGLPQEKTKIYPRSWWDAVWGKKDGTRTEAMDDIVSHCIEDVKMNEMIFEKLLIWDTNGALRKLG